MSRYIKVLTAITAAVFGSVALAGSAMAQVVTPEDPTSGAVTENADNLKLLIAGVFAAALFLLAAVGLGIRVGLKYFRKMGESAG